MKNYNVNIKINFFSHVGHLERMLFTKHLSIMLSSGITIFEAIQILLSQTKSEAFRKVLIDVKENLENGKPLSHALAKYPKVFSKFYLSLVEVGEASGKLQENLAYLAKHLQKDYAFHKKVQGAMFYPVIVLVFAGILGAGLCLFVLPNLINLFSGLDVELPLMTRLLLSFSELMRDHGILIFAGLFLCLLLFRLVISLPSVQPYWQKVLLGMPIFGKIIINSELTSFCRNFGIMMQSGLSITKSLDVIANAEENIIFKRYVNQMLHTITKGKSLAEELDSGRYPHFPLIAVKMIGVGEKTGKLDDTLLYLGDFFEDEVDDATKNISTVIEPLMLLFIGVVVAFLAFSVIAPIYQFTSSVKR